MFAFRERVALFVGLALLVVPAAAWATADGAALAVPIAVDAGAELWPVAITCEIRSDSTRAMPAQTVVVPDGHELNFHQVIRTSRGEHRFELAVTGRHHPDRAVELEWELKVSESRYEFRPGIQGFKRYALHRLGLGPRPDLGPRILRVVRADIAATRGTPLTHAVRIGSETYEIRLAARSTRG